MGIAKVLCSSARESAGQARGRITVKGTEGLEQEEITLLCALYHENGNCCTDTDFLAIEAVSEPVLPSQSCSDCKCGCPQVQCDS